MSTVEVTVTTCDKCGAYAPAAPIVLGVGGVWRELDLCAAHRASFEHRVGVWFALATRVPVAAPAPPGRTPDRLPAAGRRPGRPRQTAIADAVADAVTRR